MTRRRRGGIKRGESKLASNQFAMCSPQSGPLREAHAVTQRSTQSYMEKRRMREIDQEEKRGNQKGREQASQ